jgi:hypothetical protein
VHGCPPERREDRHGAHCPHRRRVACTGGLSGRARRARDEHAGTPAGPGPCRTRRVSDGRPRAARQSGAGPEQILFGDLHVHTTFSADAFVRSLPMLQGEGAHRPPTRGISPASAPRSTSGASTTTPRPSRRSTGARPRTPSGSATRSPETPATPTHLGLPLDERCAGPHLRTTLASARRLGCGLRSRQEAPAGTTCRTRCLSSSCRSR